MVGSCISGSNMVSFSIYIMEKCEHDYEIKTCPKCGGEFWYLCCSGTNADQGGKYDPDYMMYPKCGQDYYEK